MTFTEEYIEKLAPKPGAYDAGKKLSASTLWTSFARSERGLWGAIKGSGSSPYLVIVDLTNLAFKCSCPSRQFPCKHGLAMLLLYSKEGANFQSLEEPEYVSEWINKRQEATNKTPKIEEEVSEEVLAKREEGQAKREEQRIDFVTSGVEELNLWLKDMVRLGLLDLPSKSADFFEKTAARMIDAKAPGLAGRVKAFRKIDFILDTHWQEEALKLIAELYLLLQAFRNSNTEDEITKSTIRNLMGWNINSKELITDEATHLVKDEWLVLGTREEKLDEEMTIVRTWLHGCITSNHAIIINFKNKFSTSTVINLPDANCIEAELAFYPDTVPHRAVIKKQKDIFSSLQVKLNFQSGWMEQHDAKINMLKNNPWVNNISWLIKNVSILSDGSRWIICDNDKNFKPISPSYPPDNALAMLLAGNRQPMDIAFVEYDDGIFPLGFFKDNKYQCL